MKSIKKGFAGLLLLVIVTQMACSGHDASIVGKWQYFDTTVKEGSENTAEDLAEYEEAKQELLAAEHWVEFKANTIMVSSISPGLDAKYTMYNGNTRMAVKSGMSKEWFDVIILTEDELVMSYEGDNFDFHYKRVAN